MINFQSYFSGSSGNLYSITDGKTTIMIDPGISWKRIQKAFDFNTSEVAAACLGHEHGDHSFAVKNAAKAGIDIYMLPETRQALGLEGHRYKDVTPQQIFMVGTFRIMGFRLQHDVPNCGFLFESGGEKAAYINDTFYCKYRFQGLSVIAIECNWSHATISQDLDQARKKRLYSSHFSLENVIRFLKANDLSKVRELHLLHISRDNGSPELFKQEVEKATGIPTFTKED